MMNLDSYFKKLRGYQPLTTFFIESLVRMISEHEYVKGDKLKVDQFSLNPFQYLATGMARIIVWQEHSVETQTLDIIVSDSFFWIPNNENAFPQLTFSIEFMETSRVQSFPVDYLNFLVPNHAETLPLIFNIVHAHQMEKLAQINSLAHHSALDRYLLLYKNHPELFTIVKQKWIASYLGMDSKTLSRIRAMESKKGRQ